MTLCIAKATPSNLVISSDGRGIFELGNGELIKASNSVKKLFVIDGKAVFICGDAKLNMEVIEILQGNNNTNSNFIKEACHAVLEKNKDKEIIKDWFKKSENDDYESVSAIPICLTVFEYISEEGYFFTKFSIKDNFESEKCKLKSGVTLFQGIETDEAQKTFKSKGLVSNIDGLVEKMVDTYNDLEKKYDSIGGDVSIVIFTRNEIQDYTIKRNDNLNEELNMSLVSKTGDIVLNEDGIVQTDTIQLAENVDSTHGLKLKFYIDEGMISVRKVMLNFSLEKFRAYSKGALSKVIDLHTTESSTSIVTSSGPTGGSGTAVTEGSYTASGGHNHGISPGTQLATAGGGSVTWVASGGHQHAVVMADHQHSVIILPHEHDITMPAHDHGIDYGIYESTFATDVQIIIDGVPRGSTYNSSENNVNITEWISTVGWHTVELTSTQLGRINASLYLKTFVAF
ncbi:hypothetical protein [Paenibacillus tianjinensis]|uniref:Uncharacterized protein n=1 Tax=Paenibacillus tianjinensis TaxID=2810347 RepID=A0ABX7L6B5_9BACL|nr:hypothetical protein [Paenibacillus tianjinensis]QSF43251.1 hypothetical protein JRJ22_18465 [Paenibacillus tianjinensis]